MYHLLTYDESLSGGPYCISFYSLCGEKNVLLGFTVYQYMYPKWLSQYDQYLLKKKSLCNACAEKLPLYLLSKEGL